jgi:hypothetical protein
MFTFSVGVTKFRLFSVNRIYYSIIDLTLVFFFANVNISSFGAGWILFWVLLTQVFNLNHSKITYTYKNKKLCVGLQSCSYFYFFICMLSLNKLIKRKRKPFILYGTSYPSFILILNLILILLYLITYTPPTVLLHSPLRLIT